MQTDGMFGTHYAQLEIKSSGEPLTIFPFGDIHDGANNHCDKAFNDWLKETRDVPNAYYIGLGDYVDFASASEKRMLKAMALHETTRDLLDTVAAKQLTTFRRKIKPFSGQILAMLGGNHCYEFSDGQTSDQRIASHLGVKYLGVCGAIVLQIIYQGARFNCTIFAHHGKGSGKTVGSSINNVADMERVAEADIYIMGHDHRRGVWHGDPKLEFQVNCKTGKVETKDKDRLYVRSGSFQKAYEEGSPNWIVDKCSAPRALGGVKIEIHVNRRGGRRGLRLKGGDI